MRLFLAIAFMATACVRLTAENHWPQFRGPLGNGHARGANVPIRFGETDSLVWKTALPGKAWSSPVAVDDLIWMTTAIEQVPSEEEKDQLLAAQVDNPAVRSARNVVKAIDLKLIAVDFHTGSVRRNIQLTTIENPEAIHTLNSYASPTPFIVDQNIYCHFGTFGTFCVDLSTNQIVWQRRFPLVHSVGPGSSPFVYGNLLVLIQDGVERQYVTALNRLTGETVWEVDRPELDAADGESKKSFCTPIAVTDQLGREQLICMGAHWIIAYEPTTGKEIWKCKHGQGFSVVPRPVTDGKTVYFCTGYGKPSMMAVRIDGTGDVSSSHIEWKLKKGIPAKPSPILLDGLIFVIDDTGVASCIDAATGEVVWKKRIGGNYSASPVLAGDRLYLASQEGQVTVIQPGRHCQVVAENELDDRIMASPAILENSIVVRGENALYRFD